MKLDPRWTLAEVARAIDHTNLQPHASSAEIRQLCAEAAEYGLGAVCVYPCWLSTATRELAGVPVRIATVIGFPFGAQLSRTKVAEARDAVEAGAEELDVVASLAAAREGRWDFYEHELHEIVSAAQGRLVKAILETACLSPEQAREAASRAVRAGVGMLKTSTGFAPAAALLHSDPGNGATTEAVQLLREAAGANIGVKASGGIRNWEQAKRMLLAGADRIGTSSGIELLSEAGMFFEADRAQ